MGANKFSDTRLSDAVHACADCYATTSSFVVAFSGGIDSHVLLHVAHRALSRHSRQPQLRAVHINHQLQAQSPDWEQHCELVCSSLNIPFTSVAVDAHPRRGESPEAAARAARYAALEASISENDVLLTAHHQDDQAETVLLQLFRGAGPAGLAAMPLSQPFGRGIHCRPFLNIPKQLICDYAAETGLDFVEDPSNRSEKFQRNYLRNTLMPDILARWPAATETIARAAQHSAESHQLNIMLAEIDSGTTIDDCMRVDLKSLALLPQLRQKNVLRHWIFSQNSRYPSTQQVRDLFESVINARRDAEPQLRIDTSIVRRYRDALYLTEDNIKLADDWSMRWENIQAPLFIPELNVRLLPDILPPDIAETACVDVRLRSGGESLRESGRPRKTLKSVLQERSVPPWLRDRLPLIYVDGDLVAVHGLDKFQ